MRLWLTKILNPTPYNYDANPHYLRLIRSQRSYYASNGLRWSRIALGLLLLVVLVVPIPLYVYMCAPFFLLLFAFFFSLDTTRIVIQDRQQPAYYLSILTELSTEHIVDGYFQVALHRLPLLLGFPVHRFSFAVGTLISIVLLGLIKLALLDLPLAFSWVALVAWSSVVIGLLSATLIMLSIVANYRLFCQIAVKQGLAGRSMFRALIGASLESALVFSFVIYIMLGSMVFIWFIGLLVVLLLSFNSTFGSGLVSTMLSSLLLVGVFLLWLSITLSLANFMPAVFERNVRKDIIVKLRLYRQGPYQQD